MNSEAGNTKSNTDLYDEVAVAAGDFIRCGEPAEAPGILLRFCDAAAACKGKGRAVGVFYDQAIGFFIAPMASQGYLAEPGRCYTLFDGDRGFASMAALELLAIKSTPVATIKAVRAYAQGLPGRFCAPIGARLSGEQVGELLGYLEDRFGLARAVFSDGANSIHVVPWSSTSLNSECIVEREPLGMQVHLRLFRMGRSGVDAGLNPVYVACHEFGHALHVKCVGEVQPAVPEKLAGVFEATSPISGIFRVPNRTRSWPTCWRWACSSAGRTPKRTRS